MNDILKITFTNGETKEVEVDLLSYTGLAYCTKEGRSALNPSHISSVELSSPKGKLLFSKSFN